MTAGSIEGAGTYFLGSKQLAVGGNDLSAEVTGVIADGGGGGGTGGSLVKVGTGTLVLSGTNTYTGGTTVDAGTLIVDGSIAASRRLAVNAGAIVGGTGTLPTTRINGGTLSPGHSIGTISIKGNLVLSTAATYLVEVSPNAADRANVSGKAQLAGTLQLAPAVGSYAAGQQYVLLNAKGGVTGTFSTVVNDGSFGNNVVVRIAYDANEVVLALDPAEVALTTELLSLSSLSLNQINVANALNTGFSANALPADFLSLFNLPAMSLPGALSQLSGEVVTAVAPAGLEAQNRFLMLMIDPFAGVGEAAGASALRPLGFAAEEPVQPQNVLSYAPLPTKAPPLAASFERRWSAWAATYGSQSRAAGDAAIGSHDRDVRTGNIASGLDYRLSPNSTVGFAISGGSASFSLSDGLGSGRGDIYQLGAYAATHWQDYYFAASVALSRYDFSESRAIEWTGAASALSADAAAHGLGARFEAGRRYAVAGFGVTPYAALQTQSIRLPAFSEAANSGSAAFVLTYAAQTVTRTRSELGVGADQRIGDVAGGSLIGYGRAAWGHEFTPDSSINPAFAVLPGVGFNIQGAQAAANAALLSAGVLWAGSNGVSLRLKADGEFARSVTTYAGNATLRVAW